MQSSQKKKGYAPENFSVRSVNLIPATPIPSTTTWWWSSCGWSRCWHSIGSTGHCPSRHRQRHRHRRSWRSLMGLPHFTNWLNCNFMRRVQSVHPALPPLAPAPSKQSVHCWTKTNTTICDQDDAGSLSFSDCVAFRFHFHFHFPCFVFVLSLSLCFVLFLLYLLPRRLFRTVHHCYGYHGKNCITPQ